MRPKYADAARRYAAAHANPQCIQCAGEGIVTFTARTPNGDTEVQCPCVDASRPIAAPWADECSFDARELARDRWAD